MIQFTTCASNPFETDLINAHLLTRDSQVIQGAVRLENGMITTEAHGAFKLCALPSLRRW